MWKKKSIVLVICVGGFLPAGLGARVEPEGVRSAIPLFSYDTDCQLSTEGTGRKVARVYDSMDDVCGFQTSVDLAETKDLTAFGATLTACRDWSGGCRHGNNPPANCQDHWAKSSANVDVDWSIAATTTDITVYTESGSSSLTGLTAQVKIGSGGGFSIPWGAHSSWRIPYGNGTFIFEAPFSINGDVARLYVDTEQVHSHRTGTWTNERVTMIWSVFEDDNGDCEVGAGDSQIAGPFTTYETGNNGTKTGTREGTYIDEFTDGLDDYILRVIMKTDNNASVFTGGCPSDITQGGTFHTWAKLVIEPATAPGPAIGVGPSP